MKQPPGVTAALAALGAAAGALSAWIVLGALSPPFTSVPAGWSIGAVAGVVLASVVLRGRHAPERGRLVG